MSSPRVRRRLLSTALISATVIGAAIVPARAQSGPGASAPCTSAAVNPSSAGGDWPAYGGDPHNTRTQAAETGINPTRAAGLSPKWVFSGAANGGAGGVNSTPVESDGCVFVGTSAGWVYGIDSTNGHLIWKHQLAAPNPGGGGDIVGSPVVANHLVYVLVNQTADGTPSTGPYVAALSESTGALAWKSAPIATYTGDYTNASPVVMPVVGRGQQVVLAGFSPAEGDPKGQGGFTLVDARTGTLVGTTYTVSPADQAKGFAGGGLWSTPAFDPATGFAYIGAGNPYSKTQEDPRTNAILKVDLHASDLGAIVASYKGNPDQYTQTLQTLASSPACAASDSLPAPVDDPVCGQLDLDFGASPNLFTGPAGQLLVGDLQKAGVYHAANAATMDGLWATVVGGPCHLCNAASTATDSTGHVYGVSAPGGVAFGLDHTGATAWDQPIGDGSHYQSTSTADGVVYTLDNAGFLDVLNAATGMLITRRPLAADTDQPMVALSSAGVSIARHLVLVAASGGAAGAAGAITSPPSPLPASTADAFVIAYGT